MTEAAGAEAMTDALVEAIGRDCAAAGFDLCATTNAAAYDVRVPDALRLPAVGRADALVVVIGNSRALWPAFAAALAEPALAAHPAPLDTYAARSIGLAVERALAACAPRPRHAVRFAPEPPPRRIALQQLADVAGLAALAPSHLCVHPIYGPWIGLRAAIVIDVAGPATAPPRPPPCDCATGCGPALERALAAGPPRDAVELRDRWRLWLAARDACPVGRAHRYDDDQLRYHYTGDRACLPIARR